MATEFKSPQSLGAYSAPTAAPMSRYPIWPALVVLAIFWMCIYAFGQMELSMFGRFVTRMGAYAVLALFTLGWWLWNGRFSRRDRWLTIAVGLGVWLVMGMISDKSIDLFSSLIFNAHVAFTLGLLWLFAAQGLPTMLQRNGLWVTFVLVWGAAALMRFDGLSGGQDSQVSWRWSPSPEQRFLASRAAQKDATADVPELDVPLEVTAQDWPEFRGQRRDSQVRGLEIDTDWSKHPPRQIWRQPVGPGWSSMTIVGKRLFTQEQRAEAEAVVCYDAQTGRELWAHSDPVRFYEALAGAGPRATPTFSKGRIYTLGGTGLLNCLDAASGKSLWQVDIAKDADAPAPQWGFSGSPAIDGDLVLAYAGGTKGKGLLAYRAETGEPAWYAATGTDGYSSPQLASVDGQQDLIMLCDTGLFAVRPSDGTLLGKLPETGVSMPVVQPQPAGDGKLVIQAKGGLSLVTLNPVDDELEVSAVWESQALKPSLNDFIIHDGAIYGFDDGIFVCLSLETGKRLWKNGRFGHGQVLLLADQALLVVLCESGEVVLLKANPKKLEELGRFTAIAGKTWNHPAVSGNRLYVRNGEEMACYELKSAGSDGSTDGTALPLPASRP